MSKPTKPETCNAEASKQCLAACAPLAEEYAHVVDALEQIETELRIKHIPNLVERAPPLEADDLKEETKINPIHENSNEHKECEICSK
jgi:hypothetical protein